MRALWAGLMGTALQCRLNLAAADTLSTGEIKTPEDAKKTVDLVISATDWATGKISVVS